MTETNAPYIHLKIKPGGVEFSGTASFRLGHKIMHRPDCKPDGIFAEWSWDGRKLTFSNDRYGLFPVYYYHTPREIALSTSVLKLLELGAPAELNEPGLAVFLRIDFFVGEDTPFKAINSVPACSFFEWTEGELVLKQDLPRARPLNITTENAIDAYVQLFRKAISRRLPEEKFAVPLSGGRDSRHILFELLRAGCKPEFCLTTCAHPSTSIQDIKVARQVASRLGLDHRVIEHPDLGLCSELRKNLITNFCSDEHAWFLEIEKYLRGKVEIFYDGIAGDILSENPYLTDYRLELFLSRDPERIASVSMNKYMEERLERILPKQALRLFSRERAIDRLSEEIKKYLECPNPLNSFYFWNRTRREINLIPYGILAGVKKVFSPFLDHDVFDFLISLPPRIVLGLNHFHTRTIHKAFPEYSDLPFAEMVENPYYDREYHCRLSLRLLAYAYFLNVPRLIKNSFLFPRLLRCLVDTDYYLEDYRYFTIFLIQLDKIRKKFRKRLPEIANSASDIPLKIDPAFLRKNSYHEAQK